jgi:hypothetical protein
VEGKEEEKEVDEDKTNEKIHPPALILADSTTSTSLPPLSSSLYHPEELIIVGESVV